MTTQCGWCKRIKTADGWKRIKCAALVEATITHGICPTCAAEQERLTEQELAKHPEWATLGHRKDGPR